ncbi:TIGR04282 family arsenosugar biosynthesis glycosyltransferase [Candidatus Oscillochloris fontis]|uniref:TIGR04282 family arsenosugar biosynthesis glycosyltransferase n=1 Tax=Candidatus Oscillochloris fontis TaxID=2496868 RepID=UPI00101DB74B|nr:TIGR04282 family arsenosugar biosynthesis glycosyltransferase [Candidatus Oscillochloris fontis]
MQPNALFVVAKRPLAGHTKTRLYPPLSPQTAVLLYEGFLRDTLELMRQVPGVRHGIAYLPHDAEDYFRNLAPDMDLIPQRGTNLGERLDNLLSDALNTGTKCAVVINSDSPTLPLTYLHLAFDHLNAGSDLVLGPCDDGGYYLIGLRQPHPRLLREVTMSTPTVLRDTLAIADELGLHSTLLPIWYDVDTVAELARLQRELANTDPAIAPHTRRCLKV